jgi:LysM repeat protein
MATFTPTATGTPTSTPTDTPAATDTPPATPTTMPPSATPTQPNVTYVVQAGDTLSSIASRFGVSVQAIMDANGMSSTIIDIGAELIIPANGGSVSPPPNPTATQPGAAPTATTRPQPPAPTATARPPTATPQRYQYVYVEGSRQEQEKGCSELGVQGMILDAAGKAITGQVTVEWQLDGNVMGYVVVNGNPVEQQGTFKFFIFPGPIYHGTKNSILQIIASESNPTPLSAPLTWQIPDCVGHNVSYINVTFRHL